MTITQKQCLLTYLGYDTGGVDGIWGDKSRLATEDFQRDFGGISVDGICGDQTEKALKHAVAYGIDKKPDSTDCTDVQNNSTENSTNGNTGTFWDEIKYFTREEFKCKCGGRYCNGYPAEMQEAVVKIADAARAHFGKPAHVISGLRCKQWNAHEGGVANSQHMYGEAIDLRIDGVGAETLRQFVSTQPGHRYSYCINSTNVHFDIPAKSR